MTDSTSTQTSEQRRKRINRMKKIIIIAIMVLILIPIIICMILAFRVNKLENQLDQLISLKEQGRLEAVLDNHGEVHFKVLAQNSAKNENEESKNDLTASEPLDTAGEKTTQETAKPGDGKTVCLTFDDGPSENTEKIINILNQYGVKATFFVIGKEDDVSISRMQMIVNNGNTIGIHSYTHVYSQVYNTLDSFSKDVSRIHDLVYDATGVDTKYYRFPGGSSNQVSNIDIKQCVKYLDTEGYTYYDWNVSSGDAVERLLSVDEILNNVFRSIYNADTSIVLMHDLKSKSTTVEALPLLIERLQAEGFEIKAIDDSVATIQQIRNE